MTLFDPYSHETILRLRHEQLARTARRRRQLGLDRSTLPVANIPVAIAVRALLARITHPGQARTTESRRTGHPALDS